MQWSAAPGTVYSVTGPLGAQTLEVSAGTLTLNADAAQSHPGLRLMVSGGRVVLNASQVFYSITLQGGDLIVPPGGGKFMTTRSVQVSPDSALELGDATMLVDYTGASPRGTWTNGAYDGLAGLIQRGYAGGGWNGTGGIVSAPAGGSDGIMSLAIAEAAEILSFNGAQTTLWNGRTIDNTTAIIRYAYSGDANLDGTVNIDDYGRIDASVSQSGSVFGWFNGDFNYDGSINIDDYGIIDGNIGRQNVPLSEVAAVPAAMQRDVLNSTPRLVSRSIFQSHLMIDVDQDEGLLRLLASESDDLPA